jgi:hypothetical protein
MDDHTMSKAISAKNIRRKKINGIWYAYKKTNGVWDCICAGGSERELRTWARFVLPHPNIDNTASD